MRLLLATWGIGGVLLLLFQAMFRMTPHAIAGLSADLNILQLGVLALWLVFMGYAEGWRGFHLRFSPRVVARAFYLSKNPQLFRVLLAPAYCMSLFGSTRRGMTVAWVLVTVIVLLVVLVRLVPQPWRGIIDAGVILGLTIGSTSILFHTGRSLRSGPTEPPDLPQA